MEYEFTLKFKLPISHTDADAVVERLGEQGCTDALVGLGQAGYIGLDFVREAQSAEAALLSAIDDVKHAVPGAVLVEAGPDFGFCRNSGVSPKRAVWLPDDQAARL